MPPASTTRMEKSEMPYCSLLIGGLSSSVSELSRWTSDMPFETTVYCPFASSYTLTFVISESLSTRRSRWSRKSFALPPFVSASMMFLLSSAISFVRLLSLPSWMPISSYCAAIWDCSCLAHVLMRSTRLFPFVMTAVREAASLAWSERLTQDE